MIEFLLISAGLAGGAPLSKLTALAASVLWPGPVLALALILGVLRRRRAPAEPAIFCQAVASELRAGSPLGAAISAALESTGRPSSLGRHPSARAAGEELRGLFPEIDAELGHVVEAAAAAGSEAAGLFDELTSFAVSKSDIEHEVRVAISPARATALVFLAAPVAYLVWKGGVAGVPALVGDPGQRVAALIGLAMVAGGAVIAQRVLARAG